MHSVDQKSQLIQMCNKMLNLTVLSRYCSFELSIQRIMKKYTTVSIQVWSTTVFSIEMFLEHQISICEWLLNDHVTLKTGVMAAEKSALLSLE